MAKPEDTCTSSFCCFLYVFVFVFLFLQNKVSTLIFIDILWLFLIKQLFHVRLLDMR